MGQTTQRLHVEHIHPQFSIYKWDTFDQTGDTNGTHLAQFIFFIKYFTHKAYLRRQVHRFRLICSRNSLQMKGNKLRIKANILVPWESRLAFYLLPTHSTMH